MWVYMGNTCNLENHIYGGHCVCICVTYSIIYLKSSLARGLPLAWAMLGTSKVPSSRTSLPGKNFKLWGFGVSWVCINMDLEKIWCTEGRFSDKNGFLFTVWIPWLILTKLDFLETEPQSLRIGILLRNVIFRLWKLLKH